MKVSTSFVLFDRVKIGTAIFTMRSKRNRQRIWRHPVLLLQLELMSDIFKHFNTARYTFSQIIQFYE